MSILYAHRILQHSASMTTLSVGHGRPSQPTLSLFPMELLELICAHLSLKDLKTVRQTHSRFSFAAERSLFRDIYLMHNKKSFTRLFNISRHPRWSKIVVSLTYIGTTLSTRCRQSCPSQADWYENCIDGRLSNYK